MSLLGDLKGVETMIDDGVETMIRRWYITGADPIPIRLKQ